MWKLRGGAMDVMLLLLVVAAMTMGTADAGVVERCNGAVVELVPCADSLKGSNAVRVNHACCMALSELLLSPECLCYAATTAQGFDMKEILGLPAACKFTMQPGQTCEGHPIPTYTAPPSDISPQLAAEIAAEIAADGLAPRGFSPEALAQIAAELEASPP